MWRRFSSAGAGIAIAMAIALLVLPASVSAQSATAVAEDFSEETVGAAPTSFSTPMGWWSMGTNGVDSKPVLFADGTRYSASNNVNTLASQAQAQAQGQNLYQYSETLNYFELALFNKVPNFTQGTINIQFAVVGGDLDTDAGIVFDYQPNGDYLALREDYDASSLVLFSVVEGQENNLSTIENVPSSLARWHNLQLTVPAGGTHITGTFDGQRLMDVDISSPVSGQVGVSAKTDTVAMFNSFSVDPNGQ